ncbi:MAG: hypothetical protein K6F33_14335 [Bacteroidales bacterium]|nr:hypothetical protein [Bacteroidales bacterium]
MEYQYKILISCHKDDTSLKDNICNLLKEHIDENQIFVDRRDWYNEANEWAESLPNALRKAEYIVICIGNNTIENITPKSQINWYYEQIENILLKDTDRIIPVADDNIQFDENKFPRLYNCKDINLNTNNGRFLLKKIFQQSDTETETNNDRQYVIDKIFQLLYAVAAKTNSTKSINEQNIKESEADNKTQIDSIKSQPTQHDYSIEFTTADNQFKVPKRDVGKQPTKNTKKNSDKIDKAKKDSTVAYVVWGFVILIHILVLSGHC